MEVRVQIPLPSHRRSRASDGRHLPVLYLLRAVHIILREVSLLPDIMAWFRIFDPG